MNWDNIYAKIIETAKEVLGESRTGERMLVVE